MIIDAFMHEAYFNDQSISYESNCYSIFLFFCSIIDELNIEEHANKLGKDLSGGTKRKVCGHFITHWLSYL